MTSIIVPIYNAEAYLKACIESLLRQTEKELQIILIDDGSTETQNIENPLRARINVTA